LRISKRRIEILALLGLIIEKRLIVSPHDWILKTPDLYKISFYLLFLKNSIKIWKTLHFLTHIDGISKYDAITITTIQASLKVYVET